MTSEWDKEREALNKLLSQASILVSEGVSSQDVSIDDQLAERLNKLQLEKGDAEETKSFERPTIAFVSECLNLLGNIQKALLAVSALEAGKRKEDNRDIIGVRDLRLIHTLLQIVISWGLYPCFLPGVGVPLSKRVKSGYTNHELLARDGIDNENGASKSTKNAADQPTLLDLTTKLMDILVTNQQETASGYTTVASIIMIRHLPDLYAALLQLAYAPTPKPQPGSSQTTSAPIPSNPAAIFTQEKKERTVSYKDRDRCARMFMWLFDRSDAYRAMESLMLLLGTSPLHPVPGWLRSICGRFLSRILLKPNGVAIVLEFTLGDAEQVQLDQLEKVSQLILSVPQQMPSVEHYYAIITPQLLTLLQKNVKRGQQNSSTSQVVTFIIGRMALKYPDLTQAYIVDKITGPFLRYWNTETFDSSADGDSLLDRTVMIEEDIMLMLQLLHRVMVGEPSPEIIRLFLEKMVPALYHLYESAVKSKSGMRETGLDLLTIYFRLAGSKEAINDLKRLLLDPRDLYGTRVAYFAAGPSGGIELRLRRKPQMLGGNQLPIDTDILVEFVQTINNPDLCGDFFVFLLNEYSSIKMGAQNIDPKIMLLTLQLIMGMLDSLGPTILKKPTQILAFGNNIITEYVERLQKTTEKRPNNSRFPDIANIVSEEDREMIEDLHDDTVSVEEDVESLLLAINLLRAVIHENDELSLQAMQLLESALGPLKELEARSMDIIKEAVHEVMLAITSHLSAQKFAKQGKGKQDSQMEASKTKYREAMKALQDELLPVRAHGIGMLKEMVLAKDPLVSTGTGLDSVLDMFVRLVQDEDSFIYLNAIKGLSALTDIHGNAIIRKLGEIYCDDQQPLDNRLRVGEALLQTVQRCGDALSKYVHTLVKPLETVLVQRQVDTHLRVSALSILSMACQTCPRALTGQLWELTDWVLNILELEKAAEVRRAATVLLLSLFRGFASQTLYEYPVENLRRTYRTLRYIEETDPDELTRYQARVALSDFDVIMRGEIFRK
ncbi:uncharacterized protein BYT42DRAFT_561154 [Radiomyces spectabilis]|uniref:uncharacterized protein n=1 Tax=Radiomyces spectabilis TaxID=64574 RepID=UPI0022212095|nr:uncharacterized protein BYT42DRAFT_561154 [Radiomyces spectabilis]KAI8388768.1 hypothetical protein BYT42DRAFT_561154 [Radiomyces spectabilis]